MTINLDLSVKWDPNADPTFSFSSEIQRIWEGHPLGLTYTLGGDLSFEKVIFSYLFLNRSLFLDPTTLPLVQAASFSFQCRSHFNFDVIYLHKALDDSTDDFPLSFDLVSKFYSGSFLSGDLPPFPGDFQILDKGTGGFVVAECSRPLGSSVDYEPFFFYRLGFLRGVVFYSDGSFLAFSKSIECWDLSILRRNLSLVHQSAGAPDPSFRERGVLFGRTFLTRNHILDLCVRS